jgi:hypothetical protein
VCGHDWSWLISSRPGELNRHYVNRENHDVGTHPDRGGLGSRLLPLTRAVPKELLPVWKRPVLDYALEEAAAGIERVVIVTAPGKEALQTLLQANIAVSQLDEAGPAAMRPDAQQDAAKEASAA